MEYSNLIKGILKIKIEAYYWKIYEWEFLIIVL